MPIFSGKHSTGITNAQRLKQRKSHLLPWIVNPLDGYFQHEQAQQKHNEKQAHMHHGSMGAPENRHLIKSEAEIAAEAEEIEEATPIELFYDLFFVANLTSVTSITAITDTQSLASYSLFFIIMWFTWLQVTLYDIRFSRDSVYERVAKGLQFATMIGFATVSTVWDPFSTAGDRKTVKALKTMTVVLMGSRILLALQYACVTWFAIRVKKGVLPLVIHTITMFVAAMAYLGLFFTFKIGLPVKSYIAWFAILPLEAIAVVTSSSLYRVLSFKRTHLVERLGLLTLIVMGEGIIVMLKAVNTVAKGAGWSASIFFVTAACLAIIYIYWMFYFDNTPRNVHYGTIRQQIWALLHFPLHLAIVLSVEMLRQMTTFYSFFQQWDIVLSSVLLPMEPLLDGTHATLSDFNSLFKQSLHRLGEQLGHIFDAGTSKTISRFYDQDIANITALIHTDFSAANETAIASAGHTFQLLLSDLITGMSEFYGIKEPKVKIKQDLDFQQVLMLESQGKVLDLVMKALFSSVAIIMVMYAVLLLFVRRGKQFWDYVSAALRIFCAVVVFGLLAVNRKLSGRDMSRMGFAQGPWPVPSICLILFAFLVMDKIVNLLAYRATKAVVRNR